MNQKISPNQDISKETIDALSILEHFAGECRHKLQDLISKGNYEEEPCRQAYTEIFQLLGKALFETSKHFIMEKDRTGDGLDFYFWPGYNSIRLVPSRFTLRCNHKGRPISCGTRYKGMDQIVEPSLTSILFYKLLALHPAQGKDQFVPGSTHEWIKQKNLSLVAPPPDRDKPALCAMTIEVVNDNGEVFSKNPVQVDKLKIRLGHLQIQLNERDCTKWGSHIADTLNSGLYVIGERLWPYPIDHNFSPSTENDMNDTQKIREMLYSLWISGNAAKLTPAFVDGYERDLKKQMHLSLASIVASLKDDLIEDKEKHIYPYWHTLRLDKTVIFGEKTDSADLGSVMILVSHNLHERYFVIIRPWIRNIYLEIRQFENGVFLEQVGKAISRGVSAHELKKIPYTLRALVAPAKFSMRDKPLFLVEKTSDWEQSVATDSNQSWYGKIVFHNHIPQTIIDNVGVMVAPNVEAISYFIDLWALSQSDADAKSLLRYYEGNNIETMEDMINQIWRTCHLMLPLTTRPDASLRSSEPNKLGDFVGLCIESPPIDVHGAAKNYRVSQLSPTYFGWICRALLAALTDCALYKSGSTSVEATISSEGGNRFKVEIINKQGDQVLDEAKAKVSRSIQENARKLLSAGPRIHTQGVVTYCLRQIDETAIANLVEPEDSELIWRWEMSFVLAGEEG